MYNDDVFFNGYQNSEQLEQAKQIGKIGKNEKTEKNIKFQKFEDNVYTQDYSLPSDIIYVLLGLSGCTMATTCKQMRNKWLDMPKSIKPKYIPNLIKNGLPKDQLKIVELKKFDDLQNLDEYPNADTVYVESLYSLCNPWNIFRRAETSVVKILKLLGGRKIFAKMIDFDNFPEYDVSKISGKIWRISHSEKAEKAEKWGGELVLKTYFGCLDGYLENFRERLLENPENTVEILVKTLNSRDITRLSSLNINYILKLQCSASEFLKNAGLIVSRTPITLRIKVPKKYHEEDKKSEKYIEEITNIYGRRKITIMFV